tara:strand:+ start:1354 stop:2709 length:1356 start_codon:yes stop_codon:yes gene_type:complete
MILSILTLASALSISITAAYFSIIGLATMFPGNKESIIIMGSVLEVGKIIAAIWLHGNWKKIGILSKAYLCFALFVLMFITSMGIFGFLSKSYIVHEAESKKESAQIAQIENKINREKEVIQNNENLIKSIESKNTSNTDNVKSFINQEEERILKINSIAQESIKTESQNISRWESRIKDLDEVITEIQKTSGGLFSNKDKKIKEAKEQQTEERQEISSKIKSAELRVEQIQKENSATIKSIQSKIDSLQSTALDTSSPNLAELQALKKSINDSMSKIEKMEIEKFDFESKNRELEVEVGPVKYIVEMLNDFGQKDIGLGTAVRIVILCLIFVFDPLAVLLVVLAVSALSIKIHSSKPNTSFLQDEKNLTEQEISKLHEDYEEKIKELKQSVEEKRAEMKKESIQRIKDLKMEIRSQKKEVFGEVEELKNKVESNSKKIDNKNADNNWSQE